MSESASNHYRQLDSLPGRFAKIVHNASSQILIMTMTVIIALEVLFRYFLGAGFQWTQEVCGLTFLLLVFLCQANTWQENHHIRMDIFYNHFPGRWKALSDVLGIVCGLILYSAIVYQGFVDFRYQLSVDEGTDELMWPLWPFTLVMVVSSLVVLALLLRFSLMTFSGRKAS